MMAAKNQKKEQAPLAELVRVEGPLERAIESADKALASDKADIALDFSDCTFISVDGLEWLEELLLRAGSKTHSVTFINVPPAIYKVFKVSRIASILKASGGAPVMTGDPVC